MDFRFGQKGGKPPLAVEHQLRASRATSAAPRHSPYTGPLGKPACTSSASASMVWVSSRSSVLDHGDGFVGLAPTQCERHARGKEFQHHRDRPARGCRGPDRPKESQGRAKLRGRKLDLR